MARRMIWRVRLRRAGSWRYSSGCFLALHPKYKLKPAAMHRSGRAAHIGFAAADHALRRGLGIGLGVSSAGAIFPLGHRSRIAPAKPRFGTHRQQRQRLRYVVDRAERMQRASAGNADLVDAWGNGCFDILAATGPGVPFPFTPGRNHPRPLAEAAIICIKSFGPEARFTLQSERLITKSASGNRCQSSYRGNAARSPMPRAHRPQIPASVAV